MPPPRDGHFMTGALARLRSGVSISEAQQRRAAFGDQLRANFPNIYPARVGLTPRLIPLREDLVGTVRPALLLTESLLLAVIGGIAGAAVTVWLLEALLEGPKGKTAMCLLKCLTVFLAVTGSASPISVSIESVSTTFDATAEHGAMALSIGWSTTEVLRSAEDSIAVGLRAKRDARWRDVVFETGPNILDAVPSPLPSVGVDPVCHVSSDRFLAKYQLSPKRR
jgi:hypothetical protein